MTLPGRHPGRAAVVELAESDDRASTLIFVGGIHGVGKTTLSRRVATLLGIEHVSAGALIRAVPTQTDVVSSGAGGKEVPDVGGNQERLLRGLLAYRADQQAAVVPTSGLLLDGHFCLLDTVHRVAEIPLAVFDALQPTAVVLVEANPEGVAHRLIARDRTAPSLETLEALANRERARAAAVAARLHVPLYRAAGDAELEATALLVASSLRPHLAPEAG